MEEEKKRVNWRFIIPAIMFVFYLAIFIWLKIVELRNPDGFLARLGEEFMTLIIILPAFTVIINLVASIKFKRLSYSLGMAGLNSLFYLVLMYEIFSIHKDGFLDATRFLYSAITLGLGIVVSGIVLSIIYIYKKNKKEKPL